MALPASDTFTGTDYEALSASWTIQTNGLRIFGNTAQGTQASYNTGYWNADAFNNDQYSECDWVMTIYVAPLVRASSSGATTNWYGCWYNITEYQKSVNGSVTSFGTRPTNASEGDRLRIEASGTTLRAYIDGVQNGTDLTDGSLGAGSAGLATYGTSARLDTWEGGNLGAAPSGKLLLRVQAEGLFTGAWL